MKFYKFLLINSLIFGLLILTIEIGLGIAIGLRRRAGIGGEKTYKLLFQMSGTTGHKHYLINKEFETGYDRQEEDYAIKYFQNNINKNPIKIITLGGSTSDPYGLKYSSKGGTWPELLGKNLYENDVDSNIDIINYAQGGFTTSQEVISLLKSSSTFPADFAISLTGVNEVYFVRNLTNGYITENDTIYKSYFEYKVSKENQSVIIVDNKRFKKCEWFCLDLFPKYKSNIQRFLSFIDTKKLLKEKYSLGEGRLARDNIKNWGNNKLYKKVGDIFERNLIYSNLIAKENGIKYLTFLQPTMKVDNVTQSYNSNKRIIDYLNEKYPNEDINVKRTLSNKENYLYDISNLYVELKKRCQKLDFCYDISDSLLNKDDKLYTDPRHNNKKGNEIIAGKISKAIQFEINSIKK